ncbi:hypothetical protein [Lapillicoccus sp.]|uniref:hypothetical protein n=1 Tax=Lapillicoccus sp. TaxID=1909287 RepID=UPI003983381A
MKNIIAVQPSAKIRKVQLTTPVAARTTAMTSIGTQQAIINQLCLPPPPPCPA